MKTKLRASGHKFCARYPRRTAFTLIELMIVVALVGVLIAGVFKLVGVVGKSNQRATTIQRLQKLENAISGFYAEYGSYPPVPRHASPDPTQETTEDRDSSSYSGGSASSQFIARSTRAAGSQPSTYEFPCRQEHDARMASWFKAHGQNVISANLALGSFGNESEWSETKAFKFGLLSFLLPRLRMMAEFDDNYQIRGNKGPNPAFFARKQWTRYNLATQGSYQTQLERESTACARWLPNLAGLVGDGEVVMGVNLSAGRGVEYTTYMQRGTRIGLRCLSVIDAWDRPFFYQSLPPYQSYRVWSAGPDGATFPPDYPLELLSATDRAIVAKIIADDIVGFDK